MGTKNHRVAGYLPSLVYEKFQQFKAERQFGDSQVLIHVLSEYFGVSDLVSRHDSPVILDRIQALETALGLVQEELAGLKQGRHIPTGRSLSELSRKSSEQIALVSESLPKTNGVSASLVIEKPDVNDSSTKISLSGADLCRRLNAPGSTMSKRKDSQPDVFASWSSNLDPDSVAWKFNSDKTFSPIGDIPPSVREALKPKIAEGISHGDLAKRLNMNSSTLSHWKRDKSPDELIKAIQEKDPDGFEWIFNTETGRFIKGESSLPRVTQGELPTMGHQEGEDF